MLLLLLCYSCTIKTSLVLVLVSVWNLLDNKWRRPKLYTSCSFRLHNISGWTCIGHRRFRLNWNSSDSVISDHHVWVSNHGRGCTCSPTSTICQRRMRKYQGCIGCSWPRYRNFLIRLQYSEYNIISVSMQPMKFMYQGQVHPMQPWFFCICVWQIVLVGRRVHPRPRLETHL